jgi:NACHT domain
VIEILATKILEKAAEGAVSVLEDSLKRENAELAKRHQRKLSAKLVVATQITNDSIRRHVDQVRKWCATVNFSDLEERKSISRIYVELDTYLLPLNRHETRDERKKVRALLEALAGSPRHCVMMGGAGAGKTTSLKKVSSDYFEKGKVLLNYNFPILIRLREISDANSKNPVYERIQEILSLRVDFPDKDMEIPTIVKEGISTRVIEAYLDNLQVCILLDGFDEISNIQTKAAVLGNIETLSAGLHRSKLVVTSRSREFTYIGEAIERFEIAPLSPQQIATFAKRWLGSDEEAADFLKKVMASPFADTAIRPLTIALLCAIYERIKDIPDKPKSVYKRVVNLLLKEWDEQRSIKRTSAYSGFDVDRKEEFLAQLAFELTTSVQTLQFNTATLKKIYSIIHNDHGLPERDAESVIFEIESHNGLLVQSGYDTYEFAHKSLQEYLAAYYIIRLPSLSRIIPLYSVLPNELAIATALSSKPGDYLCELTLRTVDYGALSPSWYSVFANRLLSEKAELTIGHSVFTTIAVLFLLTKLAEPDSYVALLRPLVPRGATADLSRFYRISPPVGRSIELTRISVHNQFALPALLSVPASILEDA